MKISDEIFDLFARRGREAYFGEPVSQLEHALQTAHQAELVGATGSLVVAALLHDIGHLLHRLPEDVADRGIDGRHELIGAAWLAKGFGEEVTEPIRLHVAAKRYLCRMDKEYFDRLSFASRQSLALQGGPMNESEVREFEASSYSREGLLVRQWDDTAKEVGLKVPELSYYQTFLKNI